MRMNRLGTSEIEVSELGYGCMSLPLGDEKRATELLHRAVDAGITFFDTADLYGQGANEQFVGKTLKPYGHNVVIATKVGNRFTPGQEGWVWDATPAHIVSAVEESLKRLQRDTIDLYQLHGGTMEDQIDDVIDTFERLVAQGKIRTYGISSIRPTVIRTYLVKSNIVSVMSQYSLLDRRPEEAVLPALQAHGVSCIARGPVASGRLTDTPKDPKNEYLGYSAETVQTIRETLGTIRQNGTRAQLAILYALSNPAVSTVIPGASSQAQLDENVGAMQLAPFTEAERLELQRLAPANLYTSHR